MDATSVRVAVRIRPLLGKEKIDRCSECVEVLSETELLMMGKEKQFTFDNVFGIQSSQGSIYDTCVSPLVMSLFEGYNATVLAYGQTGSGKTYTMGTASEADDGDETKLGVIPRAMTQIFGLIESEKLKNPGSEFYLRVQFLEVYGEDIRDLLDPAGAAEGKTVSIREDDTGGVIVVGAEEENVNSTDAMLTALERGAMCRTTGSTQMNVHSSRSHAIFTIIIEQHVLLPPEEGEEESEISEPPATDYRTAKFHFVDLAGSERAKRTGATGTRLKEGININKGLLALGNVISALGDENKPRGTHVPYRDSKLTRMLQDSLGGNSRTLMIACVSPADANYEETLNALRYANRARNIKNKPVINRDPNCSQIATLKAQIAELKSRLRGGSSSVRLSSALFPAGDMRSKVRDAEDELTRVSEALEREKKLRSDIQEKYIMATAKVDYYASIGVGGDADEEKIDAISTYLRKIEDLQSQLQFSDHELNLMRKSMGAMQSEMAFDENLDDIERELSRNSQIRKELGFEEEDSESEEILEEVLEDDDITNESMEIVEELDDTPTDMLLAKENDDEPTRVLKERYKKTQESYRNMVKSYDVTLRSKQLIMQKVVEERKKFEAMKHHYEQKLSQMNEEVAETQSQRDALDTKIREIEKQKVTEASQTTLSRLKTQLKEKNDRLRNLEKQGNQLNEAKRMAARWQQKEVKIQEDIDRMKKQKVEYQKRMEDNAKKYRDEAKTRLQEIAQLKKDRTKLACQKSKLVAQNTRDERLLKQKTEQVTSMQRKLRDAQRLTLHNRKLTEKERKQRLLLEDYSKKQLQKDEELERLQRSLAKKQAAIERKADLCKELEERKKAAELRAKKAEASAAKALKGERVEPLKKQSLRSIFESVAESSNDVDSNMTPEELDAIEELENRLDAAESEIIFHKKQCEQINITDEDQAVVLPADDAGFALKELMQMYIEEKRSKELLHATIARLKSDRKSESNRKNRDMNNRRKSLGLTSPSPGLLTPNGKNWDLSERNSDNLATQLIQYQQLRDTLFQQGINPDDQDPQAKLLVLEEQVRQMQAQSSPTQHETTLQEEMIESTKLPVAASIFERLSNARNYTGIHKRKVEDNRCKADARERPVDQLVIVSETVVDSIDLELSPKRSSFSSPPIMPGSPRRMSNCSLTSASSPSFSKPTESYTNRRARESQERDKRSSSDRPAFCSTAKSNKSSGNFPALTESAIHEIKNENGTTYRQEENGLYRSQSNNSSSRNGKARQAAWESSQPSKSSLDASPSSVASENSSSEKENSETCQESGPEKLSDPKHFTGTQKQRAIDDQNQSGDLKKALAAHRNMRKMQKNPK